jgi:hypothetical protein
MPAGSAAPPLSSRASPLSSRAKPRGLQFSLLEKLCSFSNRIVISIGGIMGQRPIQDNEQRLLSSKPSQRKRRPPLCHPKPPLCHPERSRGICSSPSWKSCALSQTELSSRSEESWASGPSKIMNNAFCPVNPLNGSAALPFVIPSEAEGSAVQRTSPGNVFDRAYRRNLLFLYKQLRQREGNINTT